MFYYNLKIPILLVLSCRLLVMELITTFLLKCLIKNVKPF